MSESVHHAKIFAGQLVCFCMEKDPTVWLDSMGIMVRQVIHPNPNPNKFSATLPTNILNVLDCPDHHELLPHR